MRTLFLLLAVVMPVAVGALLASIGAWLSLM